MVPAKPRKRLRYEPHSSGLKFQRVIVRKGIQTHPDFEIISNLPNIKLTPGFKFDEKQQSFISRGHRYLDNRLRRSRSVLPRELKKNWVFNVALRHLEEYELGLFRKGEWAEYQHNSTKRIFQDNFGKFLRGISSDISSLAKPTHIDYTNFPYTAGVLIRAGYVLSPSTKRFIKKVMRNSDEKAANLSEEEFLISQGQLYLGRPLVLFKKAEL